MIRGVFRSVSCMASAMLMLSCASPLAGAAQAYPAWSPWAESRDAEIAPADDDAEARTLERRRPIARMPKTVVLDRVAGARSALLPAGEPGTPLQIGFHRPVSALTSVQALRQGLDWSETASGGRVAAVTIVSPEAEHLRVGIRVYRLPDQATVRFFAADGFMAASVSGQSINEAIQANVAAGDGSEQAWTYWSPVLAGAEATMEIEIPAGVVPEEVEVAVPTVSHLPDRVAAEAAGAAEKIGEAAYCERDVRCSGDTWDIPSRATAQMVFSDGSGTYSCTGTLMVDWDDKTWMPFFLTAKHCISTQTEASSLVTSWRYRTSDCNAWTLDSGYRTRSGGATLLRTDASADASLLMLNEPPPGGMAYAGWTVRVPAVAEDATGIHHPQGDIQKLSRGFVSAYGTCQDAPDGLSFYCDTSLLRSGNYLEIFWLSGTTESGSSGSGVFVDDGHHLAGQLRGGSSSCSTGRSDYYGLFKVSYENGLHRWLGSSSAPKSLMVGLTGSGSGSVASNPSGIACGGDCAMNFAADAQVALTATPATGSAFAGWSGACTGMGACTVAMDASKSVTATFNSIVSTSVGLLGTPAAGGTVSGVGVISGYHCTSQNIDVYVDGTHLGKAGAGTTLQGTQAVCGRTNTGYSLLYNFNNLSPGAHTVTVYADGVPFDAHVFTSFQSGGTSWRSGVSRTVAVPDFPQAGQTATLEWVQSYQNFLVTGLGAGAKAATATDKSSVNVGVLGTPAAGSTVSGIGVISGYHCASKDIRVYIDGADIGRAGAGTTLLGTQDVCGHTDTGYSLLYNFNNLADGLHTVTVYADDLPLGSNSFTSVRSGGTPWLSGVSRTITVADFPEAGQTATLDWVQSYQNFLITGISGQ